MINELKIDFFHRLKKFREKKKTLKFFLLS